MRQLTPTRINRLYFSAPIRHPNPQINSPVRFRPQPRTRVSVNHHKVRLMRNPAANKIPLTRQTRPRQKSPRLTLRRVRRLHRYLSKRLRILRRSLLKHPSTRNISPSQRSPTTVHNSSLPMRVTTLMTIKPRPTRHKPLRTRHQQTPRPINIPTPRMIIRNRNVRSILTREPMMSTLANMIQQLPNIHMATRHRMRLITTRRHHVRMIRNLTIRTTLTNSLHRHHNRIRRIVRTSITRPSRQHSKFRFSLRPRHMTRTTMKIKRTRRRILILTTHYNVRRITAPNRCVRTRSKLIQTAITGAHHLSARPNSHATRNSNTRLKSTRQRRTIQRHHISRILMNYRPTSHNNPIHQVSFRSTIRHQRIRIVIQQHSYPRRVQHKLTRTGLTLKTNRLNPHHVNNNYRIRTLDRKGRY